MNAIVYSIPVFFLLIGVELLVQKMRKVELYRFNDAVGNISCGITQQVSGVFFKTLTFAGYLLLYDNFRFFDIPENLLSYTLLFIGIDFFYYWFHRYAHEISLFWGTHVVHHQSEDYNLSVALRQSALQTFFSSIFYLPLALIGFNPIAFVTINAFQTLYQFWIHTKTIKRMPAWFEFIFNTPSHHRVHHGVNPKYIDKNHGGTLIIFDRMFGTFQREEEEVVYGVTKPLGTFNPVWANIDYYKDLFAQVQQTPGWQNKLQTLFQKPGWRPEEMGGPLRPQPISPEQQQKYNPEVPVALNYYVLFQFVVVLGGASLFLFKASSLATWLSLSLALCVIWSVGSLGALLDGKTWAPWLEYARLLAVPLLLWLGFADIALLQWMALGFFVQGLVFGFWLYRITGHLEAKIVSKV